MAEDTHWGGMRERGWFPESARVEFRTAATGMTSVECVVVAAAAAAAVVGVEGGDCDGVAPSTMMVRNIPNCFLSYLLR